MRTPTVLVVDDEPLLRAVVKRLLLEEGYLVLTATSPADALALATAHASELDLVLSDLLMPEMRGDQLACALRLLVPDVPVVFMSALGAEAAASRAASVIGATVLEKPFEFEALSRCVRDALATHPRS